MTRFVVLFQASNGDLVGRPHYTDAHSVTLALKEVGVPRESRVHSVIVHEVVQGVRVPVWHQEPTYAPSNEWSSVG